MERNIIIRVILFNLILAGIILLDLCIPGTESEVKELSSFYSAVAHTGHRRRLSSYELHNVVEFTDGDSYRIANLPDEDYPKGTKLKIVKSVIADNVNEIIILDKTPKKIYVGLLYNTMVFPFFVLAIIISLLNYFIPNKGLNIALVASAMFMAIFTFIYTVFY